MRPYRTYSKESKEEIDKATEQWIERKELSTDLSNNNEPISISTSYFVNDITLALLNQSNRETRRKEMKRHNSNSHELNIGRINPMYTKAEKDFCQKQKKKQFNDFIKGKVK